MSFKTLKLPGGEQFRIILAKQFDQPSPCTSGTFNNLQGLGPAQFTVQPANMVNLAPVEAE